VQPVLDHSQASVDSYYKRDLVAKKGTTKVDVPLFTIKGLQNFSKLPTGDPRLLRASTTHREVFTDPARRPSTASRFDHLQDDEPVDVDGLLGPINFAATTEGPLGAAETTLRERRRRYYRDATEGCDIRLVNAYEVELQDKIRQRASGPGGVGSYQLRSAFRFFDQTARGAIDMHGWAAGLVRLGLYYPAEYVTALFARYDRQQRGLIGYYDFVDELVGADYFDVRGDAKAMGGRVKELLGTIRSHTPGQAGLMASIVLEPVDVQGMSDPEFLHRQHVRKVFRGIDLNNNGTLELNEVERLLVLLGIRVTPYELQLIFAHMDPDSSGFVAFDEFYAWYQAKPVPAPAAPPPLSAPAAAPASPGAMFRPAPTARPATAPQPRRFH
jgi:Ca2+-binding EF-hand superfamily protein